MYSLFDSMVYLTLDTFTKVGKAFILTGTHAVFTAVTRESEKLG